MTSTAAPIATIFAFNDRFILEALDGVTPEESWRVLTPANNPLLWVAGHIVHTRAEVLQMLGQRADTGWGTLFKRGARIGDRQAYPPASEITRVMREISPRLHSTLSSLGDEQLNQPAPIPIPGMKTLGDVLAFFAMHDSYHLGQLGYVRKALGYPGLAG